jgi:hypothetical protein
MVNAIVGSVSLNHQMHVMRFIHTLKGEGTPDAP